MVSSASLIIRNPTLLILCQWLLPFPVNIQWILKQCVYLQGYLGNTLNRSVLSSSSLLMKDVSLLDRLKVVTHFLLLYYNLPSFLATMPLMSPGNVISRNPVERWGNACANRMSQEAAVSCYRSLALSGPQLRSPGWRMLQALELVRNAGS